MMMRTFLLLFFYCAAEICAAQQIEVDRIDVRGNKVIVWYNLQDANYNRKYEISLFSSLDGYTTALTKVKGDVGKDVKSGTEKKITWDIIAELGAFKGNLTFKITGKVQAPFVNISEFKEGRVYKRGKKYPIVWSSGNIDGKVNIELFKNNEQIWDVKNLPNDGKYNWLVPSGAKKSNTYRLKFTNSEDANDFVYTSTFTIKPRTPFIVKAGAFAVIGAAAAVIIGGKSGGSPSNNTLPDPPSTPGK
jgi:hypothetical protein